MKAPRFAKECAWWCLLVVSAAAALPAHGAAAITQTQSFKPTTPSFTVPLTFNQFNTLGGARTLESVYVELTLNVSGGDATVDNDGVESGSVTVSFGGKGSLSSSDVSLVNSSFQPIAQNVQAVTTGSSSLGPDDGDGPGVQTDGTDWWTMVGQFQTTTDGDYVAPAAWTGGDKGYIATGTFSLSVAVDTAFQILGISGVAGAFNPTTASGDVTIIYTYVPEPAETGLVSAVLLGLLGVVRRRWAVLSKR